MGQLFSLNNNNNAEEENEIIQSYRYPTKAGNYFSSTFIMGGERFDQSNPESYLFGENSDLNWFATKPTAFPYLPPKNQEPTKALKSYINIRKESVKFVKSETGKGYNIEFIFDADLKCAIKIYYFCSEEITNNSISYQPKDSAELASETFRYEKGASQTFTQPSHIFCPNNHADDDMQYSGDKDIYPIVIHCVIDEILIDSTSTHSHTTICVVDHHASDGEYHLRAMKQKIFVDGLCYLLQEIYGIENKNLTRVTTDDDEDNGSECVICICEPRDTLILPCKHLCLCNSCADSLRYQANNCPICRSPFRALLQIRAVQKSNTPIININQQDGENIPIGYVSVSLIEALNGPYHIKRNSIDRKGSFQTLSEKDPKATSPVDSLKMIEKCLSDVSSPLDETASVELKKSASNSKDKKCLTKNLSLRDRDCVKYVNEKSSMDDDSEAEKLSPLLVNDKPEEEIEEKISMHKSPTEQSISVKNDEIGKIIHKGEDSDYYTPDDPDETHTILSSVKSQDVEKKESRTPLTSLVKDCTELPDSPLSGNSQVSSRSGDSSYSSSSSTRQLLSSTINDGTTNVKTSDN